MHRYITYGLDVRSSYSLPELETGGEVGPPDIVVRRGNVSPSVRTGDVSHPDRTGDVSHPIEYGAECGPNRDGEVRDTPTEPADPDGRLTVRDGTVTLEYPSVGSFRIRDGSEIVVDAEASVDREVLTFHLLGPALAVALHQRGRLVLHASAVAIDDRAVVFLGDTHAGKSTLAASCADAGHRLLVDDLAALERDDGSFHVGPGFPSAKLDFETATALDRTDAATAPDGGSAARKAYYPTAEPPSAEPPTDGRYPVERIYLLANRDAPRIGRLPTPDAVASLYRHAYVREVCERTGESATLLERCGTLAAECPVKRFSRPWNLDRLPADVERIEADVRG